MPKRILGLLALASSFAFAAEPKTERAPLLASSTRKAAPAFRLIDASGRAVSLSEYRGKPLLLDFWATNCGGCVLEIPWFIDLDQEFRAKGVAVVGISMDILYEGLNGPEEAWSKVRPFIAARKIGYPILMGDDPVTKAYAIEALPVTRLIDKHGRIAATYVGLVDKNDVKANIEALLAEK